MLLFAKSVRAPYLVSRVRVQGSLLFLLGLAAVVLLAGYGLRDPWPADEPRFALIARDMLASGDWLLPRVGGDLYADKPPLALWMMAASIWLTGSVRWGFLLPSVLAGLATIATVYDLTRRLYNRETAFWAGIVLLTTIQFPLEFKGASIDPVLTMFTTLGLYGLLRHVLLGPSWGWYAVGGFACGLGVITKGVGFLPLLVLLPYALLAARDWPVRARGTALLWLLAPAAALCAIAIWLVPLLALYVSDPAPALRAYLHEILLGQTIDRYLEGATHQYPWWYFATVIPWAWLPVTLALAYLVRHWREAIGSRDLRVALLLAWIVIVVTFFSLSSGKRAEYLLPALPALAVITAPYVESLLHEQGLQRLAWLLLALITASVAALALFLGFAEPDAFAHHTYGMNGPAVSLVLPVLVWAVLCAVASGRRHGLAGLATFLLGFWVLYGIDIWPRADVFRSGRIIMEHAYARAPADAELGILAAKESLLLHAQGTLVNFGHRRQDKLQEQDDAARWLGQGAHRWLILPREGAGTCFDLEQGVSLGYAHGTQWLLAPSTAAQPGCERLGLAENVIVYRSPANLNIGAPWQ